MKIPKDEYMIMLMELQHMGKLLHSLQIEEQRIAGVLAHPQTRHNIQAQAKLPRVRKDIASIMGIIEVQGNIVNNHIEETYEFKFESFKTKDYSDVVGEANKLNKEEAKNILLK